MSHPGGPLQGFYSRGSTLRGPFPGIPQCGTFRGPLFGVSSRVTHTRVPLHVVHLHWVQSIGSNPGSPIQGSPPGFHFQGTFYYCSPPRGAFQSLHSRAYTPGCPLPGIPQGPLNDSLKGVHPGVPSMGSHIARTPRVPAQRGPERIPSRKCCSR